MFGHKPSCLQCSLQFHWSTSWRKRYQCRCQPHYPERQAVNFKSTKGPVNLGTLVRSAPAHQASDDPIHWQGSSAVALSNFTKVVEFSFKVNEWKSFHVKSLHPFINPLYLAAAVSLATCTEHPLPKVDFVLLCDVLALTLADDGNLKLIRLLS